MIHTEVDWPGVLRLAGRFCSSERGRERLLASTPSGDPAEVRRRAGVTRDLVARTGLRPPVRIYGLDEGAPLVSRLGAAGQALPPEELLDLFALVERSEEARRAVPVEGLELPDLTALLAPLGDLEDLLGERDYTFEPDGRIRDTASARLASIRAAIVRLRRDVVRRLEELVRARPDALADGYVTEKGGRYCLPVRSDRRESVAGIVHEKSGSGQTLFVEPLAVVEANNALSEAFEEEREEIHRILVALTARFAARKRELTAAVEVLTELDGYQARAELARRSQGVFPETDGPLVLKKARHPLLDRRLAPLREEVFGERAEERGSDAVPLDLVLDAGQRLVLLSGPNAGGKTVAMKTVGLFALLAQSGFAVPADPGTSLPVFDKLLVVAGDAQDLLGDLSSFAGAMTRTAAALAAATPRSLVLLDELGSGTDPDEGGAIAMSVLEEDLRRGGLTVATTHLAAVKEWAHDRPDVLSAAMEFDESLGRPTFRVRPGATGRSRALAVAERSGIPRRVLEAARERLGSGWAAADAALERLESETRAARAEAERLRAESAALASRRDALEREAAALATEKQRLRERAKTEIDRAIEALRERTRRELDRIREEARAGRAVSRGALMTVVGEARKDAEALFEMAAPPEPSGPVVVGERVKVVSFGTTGKLLALDEAKGQAEVEVGGKRMKVGAADLRPATGAVASAAVSKWAPIPRASAGEARVAPAPKVAAPRGEIVLVGLRVDAALPEVERAINDALLSGKGSLRIVHGFGSGRLAAAVREFLADHPGVSSFRPGDDSEGGDAATIAEMKD
ncbi:MAG: Smr/MutS family protein [Thermoanaerobaculia bacterium]|nr:Smr/MutS family protein [Thermoanaerobaculia bacterium]